MATEVYWAARDLRISPVGNHHFLLIVLAKGHSIAYPARSENGARFVTLGAFKKGTKEHRLIFEANNATDVRAVREFIDPKKHTSHWKPDSDLERHTVPPPGKLSGIGFAQRCAQLAKTYEQNERLRHIEYTLANENCSAWVNSLLKAAGVSLNVRMKAGEFRGVDWGEEDQLPAGLFQRIIARAGQIA